MALVASPIDAQSVASALSKIAEIASETLELQDVFDRVAAAIRELIPFDNMGVVRILDDERAVLHASTVPCKGPECSDPIPLTSWSPRMRPRPGPNPIVRDAQIEFDPAFHFDAKALQGGVRSAMWEPFRSTSTLRGGVWLAAYSPYAFTEEHQEVLRPIAALLGSAVEHWRIWDTERRRRERLDRIEALLGTLAESLDVTEVFQRLSNGMQSILPHDMMCLTELDVSARTIRIKASAGLADIRPPDSPVELTDLELTRRVDSEIVDDIPIDVAPDTERQRLIISSGMRSWLRVPVRLSGEIKGGLSFFHREPSRFSRDDAEVAQRLADRIALTYSLAR